MVISTAFDDAVLQPFEIDGDSITFDLRGEQKVLSVLVHDAPRRLIVRCVVNDLGRDILLGQGGLLLSEDSKHFRILPIAEIREGVNTVVIDPTPESFRLTNRYPYGRDALDRLLADTRSAPRLKAVRILWRGHRSVPILDFGEDDGQKPIHYIIAGEDVWETVGSWIADSMVRSLCTDEALASSLLDRSLLRIVPLASPYSLTVPHPDNLSYINPRGEWIYGAATWTDPSDAPEYAVLREEITSHLCSGRLQLVLNIHGGPGPRNRNEFWAIKNSGTHTLDEQRSSWALETMERLANGLPNKFVKLSETTSWPGLARDFFRKDHGYTTFLFEIFTCNDWTDGLDGTLRQFRETAVRVLSNIAAVPDWTLARG